MRARDWKLAGSGYPVGTWRFDVDEEGLVDVYNPGMSGVDFSTEFAVSGDRLTVDSVPVCPGTRGRYTWRATNRALTLTVAKDKRCAARAALFGGTWRRGG
jgi:hypothetical protein